MVEGSNQSRSVRYSGTLSPLDAQEAGCDTEAWDLRIHVNWTLACVGRSPFATVKLNNIMQALEYMITALICSKIIVSEADTAETRWHIDKGSAISAYGSLNLKQPQSAFPKYRKSRVNKPAPSRQGPETSDRLPGIKSVSERDRAGVMLHRWMYAGSSSCYLCVPGTGSKPNPQLS